MQSANSIVDVGTLTQDARHGPLPLLLIVLTIVTGLVDAVSYLKLGHVFVANMTGNVVFLGFAAAGASEFSVAVSLAAIGSFLLGSLAGGRLGSSAGQHRGQFLALSTYAQVSAVGAAFVVSLASSDVSGGILAYALVGPMGHSGIALARFRFLANAAVAIDVIQEFFVIALQVQLFYFFCHSSSLPGPATGVRPDRWQIGA